MIVVAIGASNAVGEAGSRWPIVFTSAMWLERCVPAIGGLFAALLSPPTSVWS
jgi:hypothetical protein